MQYKFIDGSLDQVLPIFNDYNEVALDLETTGLSPIDSRILLCQLYFREGPCFVIDATKVDIAPLIPFFNSYKWTKIIHKADFESQFLLHFFGCRMKNVFDTMLAEQVLIPGGHANGLDDVVLKYTGKTLNKAIRKSFTTMGSTIAFTKEQLDYAADDVIYMFEVMDGQKVVLDKEKLIQVAALEFELAPVIAEMKETGIPIDVEKWKSLIKKNEALHEESRLRMLSILYDENGLPEQTGMFERDGINLRSTKQVKEALHNIGLNVRTTDESELALLEHPAAKELLTLRGYQKILSSYGESFIGAIHPFTGRVHPDFQQIGTETGRFSCREPNVQQIPPDFRACVGDPANYVVVIADYSQFELRILAQFSRDPALIKAFNSGEDPHKSTAAMMFKIPIESVTKDQRYIAKTLNFGLVYGMGYKKLKGILNEGKPVKEQVTLTKAQELLNSYKRLYSGAIGWLDREGIIALRTGVVETLYGRKRYFRRPIFSGDQEAYDAQIGSIKRQGANAPIQGSNADVTKMAMVAINEELNNYYSGSKIINQVHDEIVVLAQKSQALAVKDLVTDCMIKAASSLITVVPVTVVASINEYWEKG